MSKLNRLYDNGERFGRNKSQNAIDIFKKDLLYINEDGLYAIPGGPNPDDSLVRSAYERSNPQVYLKRSHIKEIMDDRNAYYEYYNSRRCDPDKWAQQTANPQLMSPERMSAWGLMGHRAENKKNVRIDSSSGKVDLQFNIYNRRPNHERIQVDGHRWLYDTETKLESPPTTAYDGIRSLFGGKLKKDLHN